LHDNTGILSDAVDIIKRMDVYLLGFVELLGYRFSHAGISTDIVVAGNQTSYCQTI
jgi:hypothetical protein